jgi:ATP-dependent RNA helicase RhlB
MNTASDRQRPGGAIGDNELERRRVGHAAWSLDLYQVPEVEGKKRFHDFDLPAEIMHAVADKGFQYCTPIQEMSLVHALAGKNVAGKAQTGTGKTAAFLVAILTRYLRTPEGRADKGGRPRALVIAPTRELVIQICKDADELGKYCGLRSLAVYGGMDYERQKREVMDEPVDLLVATPGRLLDFARSRVIDLSMVDTLVIDEADRMLDMGFIPDVRTIIRKLPPKEKRGTMLYSATLSEDVMQLASQWMEEPVRVETEVEQVTTKTVKQVVYVVTSDEKFTVLYNHIQQFPESRILVFCNRRTTTDDVADSLERRGVRCETLSGDVNQNRRLRVLEDFRSGKTRIVVATDVAGRGLHVDDIGFVINFDFPYAPEDYVHRIGRTGRAGASGVAISFADEDESFTIPEIEKFINEELKCTMLKADDPLLTPVPKVSRREHHREHPAETAPVSGPEPEQESAEIPVGEDQAPASAFVTDPPAVVEPVAATATAEVPPVVAPPAVEKHETVEDVQPVKPVKVDKPEHKAPHFTRHVEHVAAPAVAPAAKPAAPEAPHFTRHVEHVAAPAVAPAPKPAVPEVPRFTRHVEHVAAPAVAPAPKPGAPGRPARFSEEWVPGGEK